MTTINTAKYKFEANLLAASYAKTIEDAKKEWVVIYETKLPTQSGKCICQHMIKNVTWLYNRLTRLTIMTGSACCKKFNMSVERLKGDMFTRIVCNHLKKGNYETINNIIQYSDDVRADLIQHCVDAIKNYEAAYIRRMNSGARYLTTSEFQILKNEILDIKQLYSITYLDPILLSIDNAVNKMNSIMASLVKKRNEAEKKRAEEALARLAEHERQEAERREVARLEAETARRAAETARREAETARREAETARCEAETARRESERLRLEELAERRNRAKIPPTPEKIEHMRDIQSRSDKLLREKAKEEADKKLNKRQR